MTDNLKKLQSSLPEGCDAALIVSDVDRRYYTGMQSSAGTLLVTRDSAALIIDFRYFEKAKATVKGCEVILQDKLYRQAGDFLNGCGAKNIAVESERMTVSQLAEWKKELPGFEFVTEGLDSVIRAHRRVKSEAETAFIRGAQAVTDRVFSELLGFIRAGVTEREVRNETERLIMSFGGDGAAFDTIAVSGRNSSLPHGVPTDKPLERGDFLTLDFGAKKGGYCSDMTRTVAIGAVSDEQRRVYQTVLEAQQRALSAIAAGVKCADIDFAARDFIERENGYKGCFGHSLGHSLGLEIHEAPNFSPKSADTAGAGNVMSVEPGIYLEGRFGVRIEDIVVVREGGCENLTRSPKELIIL